MNESDRDAQRKGVEANATAQEIGGGQPAQPSQPSMMSAIPQAALRRKIQRRLAQRKGNGDISSETVHAAAEAGTQGAGGSLPHAEQIQKSFGHHDVSGIQAHTDGKASAASKDMGAEAYASGNHVAFAGAPSLHTAAHEAAHVVQQAGGVHLSGGVGAEGDAHERHADAVADAVVRGESAQGLLDQYQNGAGAPAAMPTQRRSIQRKTTFKHDETGPDVTIDDFAPSGAEKIAVDEALGYMASNTPVVEQAWAKSRIKKNKDVAPGAVKKFKWGESHANRDGDLPGKKGAGGYKEYYVRKGDGTDGGEHEQRRIVTADSGGKKFYTNTHYGRDGKPAFHELA